MSSVDMDLIQLVDERIRLHDKASQLMGTVVTRDSTGPGATVLFDGSTVAVPVKCMGHVFCQPSDRVSLARYGSDWLIIGSFSGPGFGEASKALDGLPSTTAQLTSSSFIDLPEYGTLSFTKYFDNTYVRMSATVGALATVAATHIVWALRFTPDVGGVGYTPTDLTVVNIHINTINSHLPNTGFRRQVNIPAGTYTVALRWRRSAGTGVVTSDANDYYAVELDEGIRQVAPFL
jgi:hypothetical protein